MHRMCNKTLHVQKFQCHTMLRGNSLRASLVLGSTTYSRNVFCPIYYIVHAWGPHSEGSILLSERHVR